MFRRYLKYLSIIAFFCAPSLAHADCAAAGCVDVKIKIISCKVVDPETGWPPRNYRIKGFPAYKGAILAAKILERSSAKCGVEYQGDYEPLKDIAAGAEREIFTHSDAADPCKTLKSENVISAKYSEACCDGDPNPPCLLGFSGYIFDLKAETKPEN